MNKRFQTYDTNKWLILIVTTLGAFMTPFDTSAVNVAIPSIGSDLGGELILLSWVSVAYLLSLTAFLLVFGRLGDMKGRKPVFVVGILVFTSFSVLSAFSNSLHQLIAARLGQGVGASMMSGSSFALAASAFPSSERGKTVGMLTAATYAGLSIGPVLGGFLSSQFGWRSIFYVNIPIGLVTASVCHFRTQERFHVKQEASLDILGALSLIASISSVLVSVTFSGAATIPRQYILSLASLAVFSFLLFILVEKKLAPQPLVDVGLFTKNRMFALSNMTALLHYVASYGIGFLLSLYLQVVLRLDAQKAGLIMLSQPLLMAIVSPFSGHLSDRIEPRFLSSLGLGIMSAAILFLSGVTTNTTTHAIVLILVILGLGYGLFSSPNSSAVMGSIPRQALGIGSGTLATMRFLGQSLSLAVVTFTLTRSVSAGILVLREGQLNVPVHEFLFGLRTSLQICAIIGALAVVVSMARGKQRRSMDMSGNTYIDKNKSVSN